MAHGANVLLMLAAGALAAAAAPPADGLPQPKPFCKDVRGWWVLDAGKAPQPSPRP